MRTSDAPGITTFLRGASLLALLLVVGCASLLPQHPPRIDVTGVRIDGIVGPDAYFTVSVSVENPDASEVVIDALQGALTIEGERIAQATLAAPVRVPAGGSAQAELSAHAGMDAVLRAVASAMQHGANPMAQGKRPTLRYSIDGSATLGNGARLPFRRSGEIGQ